MAQPNKPPKTMSSRLLTMKFMQRAAASPSSLPGTPSEPPSKKQRLSNGAYYSSSPSTPGSDAQAVQDALAAEEQKRAEALEREAADRGETKWYLSFKEPDSSGIEPLRIMSAGFSTLDAADTAYNHSSDEEDGHVGSSYPVGRRSFGKFNRAVESRQNPNLSSDSSDSSASEEGDQVDKDDNDDDDPTGAKAMIAQSRREAGKVARAERKAKRKAEHIESAHLADERRQKHIKLNKLTSISGGGKSSGLSTQKDMACFKCGEKGHLQRNCPQTSQQQRTRR